MNSSRSQTRSPIENQSEPTLTKAAPPKRADDLALDVGPANLAFVEDLYFQYSQDPQSVDDT